MNKKLATLEKRIGYSFQDAKLLEQALTHASRTSSTKGRSISNERLEFLGDRVLGLIIAELLYQRFPDEEEGAMSRRFTALVRMEALSRIAESIDLSAHLNLSRSEDETGGRDNPAIQADACEALIAALYLDGGIAPVQKFIQTHWEGLVKEDPTPPKDAKTALQEWTQGRELGLPEYKVADREGPSHAPVFIISVDVIDFPTQNGKGTSKRKAEQVAAEA
ncbi:MAG: ribonuclease III, partial [Rhodospirillales bacterium]|nr:ribonuclease III [Rhodospirillales bacterium]